MARDIEEFLRKAAQRRAQAQQAANQARGGPPQGARAQPARQPQPSSQRQPDIVIGEVVEPVVVEESLRSKLKDRDAHRASEVALADEKIAAHLHEKFEHHLGSLRHLADSSASTGEGPDPTNRTVDELVRMLRNPTSLRAAIIISEVLERPEHRW